MGSNSSAGARGNFLKNVLERLAGSDEDYARMIARSLLISTDNAHGVDPNFADKHDNHHGPVLNRGPVVKVNSNQSYATNSESAALFKHAAARAKVELQSFVTRSDMGCGSTIGPLTAAGLGCVPWTSACRHSPCIRFVNWPAPTMPTRFTGRWLRSSPWRI